MNQSGTFDLKQNVNSYSTSERFGSYTGVNLWLAEDASNQFTVEDIRSVAPGGTLSKTDASGVETIYGYKSAPWSANGRVMDIVNPFGSPAMASNILRNMIYPNGLAFDYAPFASDAMLPPHFEIGDAVMINGNHHGIYSFTSRAGRLLMVNIKAQSDEEIDHEYPVKADVKARQISRKFNSVQAQFNIQAGEIAAKVSKEGVNAAKTFAWSLTEDAFRIHNGEITANTDALFRFDETGLHIRGEIEATTGKIGKFNIGTGIWSGKSSLSSDSSGVYVGTDGISVGSFRVTSGGHVTAVSGTFGSLNVSNGNTYGTYYGGLSGCGGSVSGLGGSVSGGMSFSGTEYTAGSLASQVDYINARYITAEYVAARYVTAAQVRAMIADITSLKCYEVTCDYLWVKKGASIP